jgi:hypothetical protein
MVIKNSFITSADKYLYGLSKLARYDFRTLQDLFLLSVIGTMKDMACWYEVDQKSIDHLSELEKCIIINNTDLELYEAEDTTLYTNVNTAQTIFNWQRNFDREGVQIIDDPADEVMLMEDNTLSELEQGNGNLILLEEYGK